jgi:hypothetical protein
VPAPSLAALVSRAALAADMSVAAVAAAALASAGLAAGLVRGRDVAGFARLLVAVLSERAAGVVLARVLAVFLDPEDAAVLFDRAPGADALDREPCSDAVDLAFVAGVPDGAVPLPSVAGGRTSDPAASPSAWLWSAWAASANRGRPGACAWLSVPAGCLLAARLGAGPVPPPAEFSPGIPFTEVTAP